MKNHGVGCQVCLTKYTGVAKFKQHVRSVEHRQKMANVFQKDKFKVDGFFPTIFVMNPRIKQPIIGLSLLTVCFSPMTNTIFYLCHACKEKCPTMGILYHISSSDHCSNYYSYTNPNVLSFAWLPNMNMTVILEHELTEEICNNGLGQPQMLHLPGNLLEKLSTCTYSEVMHTLRENDELLKLLQDVELRRMMIQTYYEDRNRKHPLLGLQHIIECICVGPTDKRYYLCTLCKLTLANHMIIKHLLSFDHIFCYFRAWHPSTLLSRECYMNYTMSFASMILDFAKQSEEIHGAANTRMKQVNLEPAKFASVNFSCYAEALNKLESITKENKESSLIASVQPGSNLVPWCETNSKLKPKERFPALGMEFLVKHMYVSQHQPTKTGCLCLLCKRRFPEDECHTHLFSQEHVKTFLNCFHPGSLNSSTDPETLLDLAKQAACYHQVSDMQVIRLNWPICEPCPYQRVITILAHVKRENGNGKLDPPITPTFKLVSRKTLKDVDKDHVTDSSQEISRMMEGSEKKTTEESTGSQTSMKSISVEAGAEVPDTQTQTTPSEKESDGRRDVFSKTSSGEIENAVTEAGRPIKMEREEEPAAREPIESCQNTDKADEMEIKVEGCASSKEALTQENERKRPSSMEKEMDHKRPRLISKEDASCEEPQNLPSGEQKEATTADEGGSGKPSHETAKDKASSIVDHQPAPHLWQYIKLKNREPVVGLGALIECHCDQRDPIYLCACCSLIIPEKDIIAHVTGVRHQQVYLEKLRPPPEGKTIRHYAALYEQEEGFGEAQVIELDEDMHNNISKQNFDSAMQTMKALHAAQDMWGELPLTSDRSDLRPVDTSVTLHAQHEGSPGTEEQMVVAMEVKGSEDCGARPSSVAAAVSVKIESCSSTTEAPPESNEDFTMTAIKASESADDTNACPAASRSSEGTSSRCVSTSGTNTTRFPPHSTGNNLKDTFSSNSTEGPQLKITTTSEIVGTSKYAASLNSTTTPPSTSTADFSESTAKSFTPPPHTTKSPAAKSKPTTSSCSTAVTRFRETACAATPPGVAATATKATATISISTAASSKVPGTSSTSSATVSCTTAPAKSATVSKPLENTAGAAVAGTSCKATSACHRGSTVAREAPYTSTPAIKIAINSSNNSVTASKTTVRHPSSAATAKLTQTSDTCENTGAPAKTVHVRRCSVGSYTPKSSTPAEPHLTTLTSVQSGNKSPPTEPSHLPTSKTKPRKSPPTVGLNQLIIVMCKEKQQVYCQLCSLRLERSSHRFSLSHQFNYLKMKFPGKIVKLSEFVSTLDMTVARLAEAERGNAPQKLDVDIDVYKELEALPGIKAIERLKEMLKQRDSQLSSPTADTAEVLRQQVALTSPLEASSPDDDRAGRFVQTPDTRQKTAEKRQQLERSDPELQDTRKVLESSEKTSPVQFFKPDPIPSAASANTPQDILTRHVPKHPGSSAGPVHHSPSQGLPSIKIAESNKGSSHLSTYLMVKGLDSEPIIGLGSVWECQGMTLPSFYLCESCDETLANNDICRHMVSDKHCVKYMWKQYPKFMSFWEEDNLTQELRLVLTREIARKLSAREASEKIDAQSVLLNKEMYERIQRAPFNEALKMLQTMKEQKLRALCLPTSAPRHKYQPEDRQGGEESLLTETQSAQALEGDHRSENEARPKTEKRHLEKAARVGDSDGVKQRRVSSPLGVSSVVSKVDSVSLQSPMLARHVPQDTFRSLSTRPETRPPVSLHQRPIPELQVKQAEVQSESSSSSIASPKTSQSLPASPRDKCLPTGNRPAVTSVETHVGLGGNVPATGARSSLQPISPRQSSLGYTPVNPMTPSTLLSPEDKSTGPGSDERNAPIVDLTEFANLMALLREKKAEINASPSFSAPGDAEAAASSANSSSQSGAERRCDPKSQLAEATVNTNPPSTNLFESKSSTAAPLLSHEDQLDTPNTNSAINSSLEEAEPVVTMLPSTSTADPTQPQPQRSVDVDSTEAGHLPISAIITARREHQKKQFMGGYNGQNHTYNRGSRVAHSFFTVATASPGDTFAASGGFERYSPYCLSSEPVTGYISPDNLPVYPGSSYQHAGYDTRGLYPSQIYSEQEANCFSLQTFGHSLATPTLPGWAGLEMQQQQQQQQLMQLQHASSVAPTAGHCSVTSQAGYAGAAPSVINLNEYSTTRIVPTQNSNNLVTQNTLLSLPNASGNSRPPAANGQVTPQASASIFSASAGEFHDVGPSLVNVAPSVSYS